VFFHAEGDKCYDLLASKEFLEEFNGIAYIPEMNWSSNYDFELYG
jgi:hypothetical protein